MAYHVIVTVLLAHLAIRDVTGQGRGPSSAACSLPPEKGPCRALIPTVYYNAQTGTCDTFMYGGCRGNANRFRTDEQCRQTCQGSTPTTTPVCMQPKRIGRCKAALPRWFYDSSTSSCQSFLYGGCDGNDNNFRTQSACESRCGGSGTPSSSSSSSTAASSRPDFCSLPPETGFCRAYFSRYHFNARTERCELFVYGGCGGNRNRFNTAAACKAACGPTRPGQQDDVCSLPKVRGPCFASLRMFYHDQRRGQCRRFVYGGCGGNANNFPSLAACERACPPRRG